MVVGSSYQTRFSMLGDQSDARQRIWTVLDSNSDFRLVRVEGGLVKASVRPNSLSWGEQITVSLTQGAEGADVVVRSECSFPLRSSIGERTKKMLSESCVVSRPTSESKTVDAQLAVVRYVTRAQEGSA